MAASYSRRYATDLLLTVCAGNVVVNLPCDAKGLAGCTWPPTIRRRGTGS